MSPAVVALARTFSNDRPNNNVDTEQNDAAETSRKDDILVEDIGTNHCCEQNLKSADHRKSKSRAFEEIALNDTSSTTASTISGGQRIRSPSLTQHPRHRQYHYDPYHAYCQSGNDFYKSYHLSYQAYCHAPQSKFSDGANSNSPNPCYYDALAPLRPPTKLAAARARAARLRRKITEFRARTSAWIQRLALFTISVTILSYIFTRSLIPARIVGLNQLPFRQGFFYSKSFISGLALTPLSTSSGFCDNGSLLDSFGPQRENGPICQQIDTEPVFENLFGASSKPTEDDLPFIARNVLIKFYALAFLVLLIVVSFACERLFGRKITAAQHAALFDDVEEDDDEISGSDDEDLLDDCEGDEDDDEDIDYMIQQDMYWDCEPTSIRMPRLPMGRLGKIPLKSPQRLVSDLKISILFYLLPLRLISRIWGWMNAVELPVWARAPLYSWYAKTFGCNLEEMLVQDLTKYRNLSQFFRRTLKPGVRPVGDAPVVSPADGRVVQLEQVSPATDYVGSVKGIYYSVEHFLGPHNTPNLKPGNKLYSCVVYLAPGDYHRFHSPADWTVKQRRHFSGRLLSVKPSFVAQVPDLFAINERVAYYGEWTHGFFSMTAVGATNVGTVNVVFDPELQTNQFAYSLNLHSDKCFPSGIPIRKGDLFGEFNLGSTIVLIYEAPDGAHFPAALDQKIKYGENVCTIAELDK